MTKLAILAALGAFSFAGAAGAHPFGATFDSRGACEAASAQQDIIDHDFLVETYPQLFDTGGEASSFIQLAVQCELNGEGQWYLADHRMETIQSEWFQRRNSGGSN